MRNMANVMYNQSDFFIPVRDDLEQKVSDLENQVKELITHIKSMEETIKKGGYKKPSFMDFKFLVDEDKRKKEQMARHSLMDLMSRPDDHERTMTVGKGTLSSPF